MQQTSDRRLEDGVARLARQPFRVGELHGGLAEAEQEQGLSPRVRRVLHPDQRRVPAGRALGRSADDPAERLPREPRRAFAQLVGQVQA
ncbi:hypothetical protein K7G98_15370, partial [Saccharothrix sp. MB29]|nr:hypothetical protein [Saccharothrix sp. MB29]